jgi:hypothetical protein
MAEPDTLYHDQSTRITVYETLENPSDSRTAI